MRTRTSMGDVWLAAQIPVLGRLSKLWYRITLDKAEERTLKHMIDTLRFNQRFKLPSGAYPTSAVHMVSKSTCKNNNDNISHELLNYRKYLTRKLSNRSLEETSIRIVSTCQLSRERGGKIEQTTEIIRDISARLKNRRSEIDFNLIVFMRVKDTFSP